MSDTAKERERYCNSNDPNCLGSFFPAAYACKDVYDTWWHGKPGCNGPTSMVRVDVPWLKHTMESMAAGFARQHNVPVVSCATPPTSTPTFKPMACQRPCVCGSFHLIHYCVRGMCGIRYTAAACQPMGRQG